MTEGEVISKKKRNKGSQEIREVVRVRGMDVHCDEMIINQVLGCKMINIHNFDTRVGNPMAELRALFAPLLSDSTSLWLTSEV